MELTPIAGSDRQVVESYGPRSFRVSGATYEGSILVLPHAITPWIAASTDEITRQSLEPVIALGTVEILLIGCGRRLVPVSAALRQALRQCGMVVEPMDTGAACRTYNVLLAENRRVAAALLPFG